MAECGVAARDPEAGRNELPALNVVEFETAESPVTEEEPAGDSFPEPRDLSPSQYGEDPVAVGRPVADGGYGADADDQSMGPIGWLGDGDVEEVPVREAGIRRGRGVRLSKGGQDFSDFLCSIQARREVPKQVMSDIVAYMVEHRDDLLETFQAGELQSYNQMQRESRRDVPTSYVTVAVQKPGAGEELWQRKRVYPKKRIAEGGYTVNYVLYYCDVKDIVDFHNSLHGTPVKSKVVDMSLDGVPQSKSGGISMEVLSVRFIECRTVYTVAILKPMRKRMGICDDVILEPLLEGERLGHVEIRRVVADAPKRASLQGLKQHSATYSCPYCKARKTGKSYPASTMGAEERTDEDLRRLANEVADRPPRTEGEEAYFAGVKGLSPLRAVRHLDLVEHVPAEMMHLICLGVVRKMISMSVRGGGFRQADVECRQVSDDFLNSILLKTKSLTRFSRRTRPLDPANYKAEEYRNLALVYWPAVMRWLPRESVEVWLLTVYLFRATCLDNDMYSKMDTERLQAAVRQWYRSFESAFGVRNCSYNVHVFSHLLWIREQGPLPETSALPYESHYNLLKRSYRPGTESIGTQAMGNLAAALKYGHKCRNPKILRTRNTGKTDDRYVYLRSKELLLLSEVDEEGATGRVVPVQAAFVPVSGLNFNEVLAFKMAADGSLGEQRTVQMEDVAGQAVVCDKFISVVTWKMLDG